MMTNKQKRFGLLALLLALGACSQRARAPSGKEIHLLLGTEPPQLNSTRASDTESGFLLGHIMEGLTRYGRNGEIIPGIAESWQMDAHGATFHLRGGALWADGKPVTARDFVFAWRLVVDPANASEYAFIMYPVKNAEAINKGKMSPSVLGVSAPDDRTLLVSFEKPCAYFLGLTAFPTFLPIREDFYRQRGDRFAADAQDLLSDGPFELTRWVHGAELALEKNPRYWNADNVQIDRIAVPYITNDIGAQYNLFSDGKVDMLGIPREQLGRAQADRLRMQIFEDGSVWYLQFNLRTGRPTADLHLRKAIQLVFDPHEYVSKVVGIPGSRPGVSFIPHWVPGVKGRFREEYPITPVHPNLAQALSELELARRDLGGVLPTLFWLADDGPGSARDAEYFQNLFKTRLGIDVRIDKQIFKNRLAKMRAGDFDIVSAGWGPDYADPMTYAELLASWNENNNGKYQNTEYDALIRRAQSTADPKLRMDAMAQAERIALDELPILPTYERSLIWAHQPWVQGVVRRVVGPDPDLVFAAIQP